MPPRDEAMITVLPPARPCDALLGVTEGAAGDGQAIDPGLQLGGDREVVHRRADHDDVGGQEGVEHGRAVGDVGGQRGVFRHDALAGGQVGARQVADRLGGQVAIADLQARVLRLLRGDDRPTTAVRLTEPAPRMLESM